MVIIDNISSDASQKISVVLTDGSTVVLTLNFRPAIQRWTLNVEYSTFTVNNLMLCHSPNLFRPWQKTLGFGIACTTTDGVDPIDIYDFENGRASLYILESADVEAIETEIIGA